MWDSINHQYGILREYKSRSVGVKRENKLLYLFQWLNFGDGCFRRILFFNSIRYDVGSLFLCYQQKGMRGQSINLQVFVNSDIDEENEVGSYPKFLNCKQIQH
eukprot:TRINITY_DN28354_c0_g2_i1.p4 TRINITY_DN28354_c0_g2~~TRINITY_DN28354_c0_g2_i1.p4  ORF type:complete len:103 (+),score=2.89 TRINITY_DN28354_c0_g2_i1:912-1220(+)